MVQRMDDVVAGISIHGGGCCNCKNPRDVDDQSYCRGICWGHRSVLPQTRSRRNQNSRAMVARGQPSTVNSCETGALVNLGRNNFFYDTTCVMDEYCKKSASSKKQIQTQLKFLWKWSVGPLITLHARSQLLSTHNLKLPARVVIWVCKKIDPCMPQCVCCVQASRNTLATWQIRVNS